MPPLLIGHRGAAAAKPENTLASFRHALATGADGVELDVHVTRDGVPVVFHDDDLHRLTGESGPVAARTWRQLRRLRVMGREPIPRLTEVLRLLRRKMLVQIEIKAGTPVAPIVAALHAARTTDTVILASFVPDLVADAARLAPAIPRMLIAEWHRTRPWLVRHLNRLGAAGVSLDRRALNTAATVRHFHDRGFTVWSWTVNRPADMRRLAAYGVNGIISDDPALLVRTLSPSSSPPDGRHPPPGRRSN